MMNAVYFFVDGSALTAQIRQLRRAKPLYVGRKLCPREFMAYLIRSLGDLHGGSYKRATFYFPRGDETLLQDYIRMPDHRHPGEIRDLHFKFCGHKLKKSAEFKKFIEDKVPQKFHDHFQKSEKGVDIEICCDALRLASASRIDRLLLLTNDGDFIPLCRTIKEFGANISIIHLSDATQPNSDLLLEADSYDIVAPEYLNAMFFPSLIEGQLKSDAERLTVKGSGSDALGESESAKPKTDPSDLKKIEGSSDGEKLGDTTTE